MADFKDLMSEGTENTELTISITRNADGTFMVEKESAEEDAAEQGSEMGETTGTPAKSIEEALQIVKVMFDEGNSETAAFEQGFSGDEPPMQKPPMKGMM